MKDGFQCTQIQPNFHLNNPNPSCGGLPSNDHQLPNSFSIGIPSNHHSLNGIFVNSKCLNINTDMPSSESLMKTQTDIDKNPIGLINQPLIPIQMNFDLNSKFPTNLMPRSASGGFIGPANFGDPYCPIDATSWNQIRDPNSIMMPTRTSQETKVHHKSWNRLTNQLTFVYPGHPGFTSFISPFDWSKDLFKVDQDVSTLMSWTKVCWKNIYIAFDNGLIIFYI